MAEQSTVFVVDDDEGARRSVGALVESMGLKAEAFASAEDFLNHYTEGRPGCLVTDLRMMGMSGLELLEHLVQRHVFLPVIVLTAYARTSITVQAIQSGAVTVLDKPYTDDDLWDAIRTALAKDVAERKKGENHSRIRAQIERLTPIEKDVLNLIVQGRSNKVIAKELDISLRTVANRRSEILAMTGATSTAELVRMVIMVNNDEQPR
jgi:two-component system, LuxR family, response regulator FixJ